MTASTVESLHFNKAQHDSGTAQWGGLCQKLQREARGLPGVYASAALAAAAVPMSDRVYDLSKVQVGMVGFSQGANPAGHVFEFRAKAPDGEWLVWSNDIVRYGHVDCVRLSAFSQHWGHRYEFASVSLNGFDLPGVSVSTGKGHPAPAPTAHRAALSKNPTELNYAIHRMHKAIAWHGDKKSDHYHPVLAKQLRAEVSRIEKTKQNFS